MSSRTPFVYRFATAPQWQHSRWFPAGAAAGADPVKVVLKSIVIDDWFFGVTAVSPEGWESPAVYPGDAGSF